MLVVRYGGREGYFGANTSLTFEVDTHVRSLLSVSKPKKKKKKGIYDSQRIPSLSPLSLGVDPGR